MNRYILEPGESRDAQEYSLSRTFVVQTVTELKNNEGRGAMDLNI